MELRERLFIVGSMEVLTSHPFRKLWQTDEPANQPTDGHEGQREDTLSVKLINQMDISLPQVSSKRFIFVQNNRKFKKKKILKVFLISKVYWFNYWNCFLLLEQNLTNLTNILGQDIREGSTQTHKIFQVIINFYYQVYY